MQHHLTDNDILIFLHVPKTAGSSLHLTLQQKFIRHQIYHFDNPIPDSLASLTTPDETLRDYRFLYGHFLYSDRYFKVRNPVFVTMLREPVARILSVYRYARWQDIAAEHQWAVNLSLDDFVRHPDVMALVNNAMTRYLGHGGNDLLETAKSRIDAMPFVGITERFEESAILLHYTFGWSYDFYIKRENVTPQEYYETTISPDTIAHIKKHNQLDIALYDYAQTLFQARSLAMVRDLLRVYQAQEAKYFWDRWYRQGVSVSMQQRITRQKRASLDVLRKVYHRWVSYERRKKIRRWLGR